MFAELTPKLSWYVARTSGLVAWAVVTASILFGLALTSRLIRRKGAPAWLLSVHRFLGVLSVTFTTVHLAALWADNFVQLGPREFLVPMASTWRPGAVTWGVVAMYMLVAIELTSLGMRKLPRRLWHAIHLLSFPMFAMATVHGVQSGADTSNIIVQWVALTGVVVVLSLLWFRVMSTERPAARIAMITAARATRAASDARSQRVDNVPALALSIDEITATVKSIAAAAPTFREVGPTLDAGGSGERGEVPMALPPPTPEQRYVAR
jgi:DMSO/TMAO reductase YedYZ heme-binding membrane subunit